MLPIKVERLDEEEEEDREANDKGHEREFDFVVVVVFFFGCRIASLNSRESASTSVACSYSVEPAINRLHPDE